MRDLNPNCKTRILVTGSRGKSSVVCLLHCAFQAVGKQAYARITGIVPREFGPGGSKTIMRSAPAHVEEMRWWLGQLPTATDTIIMENSAITPELQDLAGHWLQPNISVLTNTQPDHQEVWGPTTTSAADVLVKGLPKNGVVVLPAKLKTDKYLLSLLQNRGCLPIYAIPSPDTEKGYKADNMGLALSVIEQLQIASDQPEQAMLNMPPDRYDFHVANYAGAELAMAFAANDISSTRRLFRSLSWSKEETRLIYNHRADRPERFKSFIHWLTHSPWREVLIIGDKPKIKLSACRYLKLKNEKNLKALFLPGDRIFGCGNISGLPQLLAEAPVQ